MQFNKFTKLLKSGKDSNYGYGKEALRLHAQHKGKICVNGKVEVNTPEDLSLAYTPGVAQPCLEIARDAALAYTYTAKGNLVAVVSDGSAVLGLGNIGGQAAMPGYGGKIPAVQAVRKCGCFPDLSGHPGYRGDHRNSPSDRTGIRRHQSGGHCFAQML